LALTLALLCICFIEGYRLLLLHSHFEEIAGHSKMALQTLSSKTEHDEHKERVARETSLLILTQTTLFALKMLLLLGILSAVAFGVLFFAGISQAEFFERISSVESLSAMTVFSLLYLLVRNVAR
jgi:hypothetical protein